MLLRTGDVLLTADVQSSQRQILETLHRPSVLRVAGLVLRHVAHTLQDAAEAYGTPARAFVREVALEHIQAILERALGRDVEWSRFHTRGSPSWDRDGVRRRERVDHRGLVRLGGGSVRH